MSIPPGTTLGRYKIRSKIGAGGMGEVYLAQDTTELDRTVALKVLPVEVAADRDRLQRFTREARTVSNLNHPNILTIYEFGQADSVRFIATEFIDGETLRQHFSGRRLKLTDVLDISVQVVAALNAAHEAGVVHRDIKPENVMVRRDQIVKVLDFGLAKLSETQPVVSDTESTEDAKTKVMVHSEPGLVMGTVSYMSPEQSVGLGVDHRTDIWSTGVMLYEMLAGVLPFEAKDFYRQIIAIQEQEPAPLSDHVAGVPSRLEEIVVKCLAKDKDQRYRTANELLIDLKNLKRKLDVDAEIERTGAPQLLPTLVGASQLSHTGAQASQTDAGTTNVIPVQMTSSAEYLVTQIRQNKKSVLIACAVLVLAIAAIAYFLYARNSPVAIESIAVLPFVNQNHDPDSEYLSDGVTESIINSLTQLPDLKVIARSSVFRYKGKETDPIAAGKELGVRAVLMGRIMQRGDLLTISAELVDVRDNKQLWGDKYERKVSDLLSVQRDLAQEISANLRTKISAPDKSRLAKHYTENTEAYQLYLRGRFYWNKRTGEALKKSIEYFNQAIEKDPGYAMAYAGLADAYLLLAPYSAGSSKESLPKAKAAAQRALEIDETLAEAHTSLAEVLFLFDWDFAASETEFRRAIELNPNYPTAHHWYGNGPLNFLGRFDEAIAEAKRAQELDPLSLVINADLGANYTYARRYDKAIEQLRKTLEMDPNFYYAHWSLGIALAMKGSYEEAIAEYKKARDLSNDPFMLALLGHAYALSGARAEALKMLEELNALAKDKHVSPISFALLYGAIGDKDKAFEWLERSYQERSFEMTGLKVEPLLDPLRSDPRFADLLRRVGFPQ